MTQTTTIKKPSRATVLFLCAVMAAAAVGAVIGGDVHRQVRESQAATSGRVAAPADAVVFTGKTY